MGIHASTEIGVALLVAITLLGSGLAVVKARQRMQGKVLILAIKSENGETTRCEIPTESGNSGGCYFMHLINVGGTNGAVSFGQLNSGFRVLDDDGNRFQLGVRVEFISTSLVGGGKTYVFSSSVLNHVPEKTCWFEPEETLGIDVPGMGKLEVTSGTLDHMPLIVTSGNEEEPMGPNEGEIRVVSPVLLKGNQRLVDMEGFSGRTEGKKAIFVYAPGLGRFLLLPTPVAGAVEGEVRQSRIAFEIGSKPFEFLMAAPVSRSQHIWILYAPNYSPSHESPDQSDDQVSTGTTPMSRLVSATSWTFPV